MSNLVAHLVLAWAVPLAAGDPPSPSTLGPAASADSKASSATDPEDLPTFTPDDFLFLPLRIHLLKAEELPHIDAHIKDEDVLRVVGKMNRVWRQAGVRFTLESIVHEPAAEPSRFEEMRSLEPQALKHYLMLRPESSRDEKMLHVYFVHEMNVNGVYLGSAVAFVKDTAKLREVEGGIDEPIPRVMSHELGHALGLPHRQDDTNLLASGTTGTSLNAAEIRRAREVAGKLGFAVIAPELAKHAKEHYEAGRWAQAQALDVELITLPGTSALKDEAWSRCTFCSPCARRRGHARP